ncbi:MAG: hypothetical protein ACJ72P_08540 [Nocardioides sp.]
MNTNILQIGTLSLAGMVTTALFVVPMVGDNVAEKPVVKRDDDVPSVVLAAGDDNNDDNADDRFGARTAGHGLDNRVNTNLDNTAGTNADNTAGTNTGTGHGGVDNSGPSARSGHNAMNSGRDDHGGGAEFGDDNGGSGQEFGDDNGGSGEVEAGDDHGGGGESGDDSGGGNSGRG